MKKRMLCGLLAALSLLLCACARTVPTDAAAGDFPYEIDAQGYAIVTEPAWGFTVGMPKSAIDQGIVQLAPTEPSYADELFPVPGLYRMDMHYLAPELWEALESGDEDIPEEQLDGYVRRLLVLHVFSAAELDAQLAAGQALDAIAGEAGAREVARQQDYAYVVATYEDPTDTLSSKSKAQYQKLVSQLPQMVERIRMIDIVQLAPAEAESLPPFQATDLSGAFVTNAIFETKHLTMINIWGTFCGPCIEEMPDLGKLAKDMPEGTQLVGIIVDAQGNTDLAQEILTTAGATESFLQIVPDETLSQYLADYPYVPTTIFVDALGRIVGAPLEGARGEADYRAELASRLRSVVEP